MAVRRILTDAGIRAALAKAKREGVRVWVSDGFFPKTYGGLQFSAHQSGTARWYWRYTAPDGSKQRIALGTYSPHRTPGALTLTEAREEVASKATLYQQKESRDVRAHLEREAAREAAARAEAEAATERARIAAAEEGKHTLAGLFAAYTAHLQRAGKVTARAAQAKFTKDVAVAHPDIANKPAKDVKPADVVTILRAVTDSGRGRTAAILRAYLRAAYGLAARAAVDADVPAAFLKFGVEGNPVAVTGSLSKYNKTLDRALSEPELREYWRELNDTPDSPARDALLLLLLLGGQRPAQLVRATLADVDLHGGTLRLLDPKGKRTHARVHLLPLTAPAADVLRRCIDRAEAQRAANPKAQDGWLFSVYGRVPLRPEALSDAAGDIAADLLAKPIAERIVKEPFLLRDLRRTCETHLARMGVSREVRAHIQSHGLGGVQARHYDRHDYMNEKTAALAAWVEFLSRTQTTNVAPIGARVSKRRAAHV